MVAFGGKMCCYNFTQRTWLFPIRGSQVIHRLNLTSLQFFGEAMVTSPYSYCESSCCRDVTCFHVRLGAQRLGSGEKLHSTLLPVSQCAVIEQTHQGQVLQTLYGWFTLFLPCRKKQRPDGDSETTFAMSVVQAVGIEIPKVNLHLADWQFRNIDTAEIWAWVWVIQAFLEGETPGLIQCPAVLIKYKLAWVYLYMWKSHPWL